MTNHLGHEILGRDNQTREIARRIGWSWKQEVGQLLES